MIVPSFMFHLPLSYSPSLLFPSVVRYISSFSIKTSALDLSEARETIFFLFIPSS